MSKYDDMMRKNQDQGDSKAWTRYGLSESEWKALSTEQREIHYNRQEVCEHPYEYQGIETAKDVFIKDDDRLRPQYSFDPYFHTAHMFPHSKEKFFAGTCECQTCVLKVGILSKAWKE